MKKGIAPLIATILLLSFAVSIGVVVMNFGKAQVELGAECAIDVGLELQKDVCFESGVIKFTLSNGINIKVEGLLVNVIGMSKAETSELNNINLGKAGVYSGMIRYDKGVSGEVRQMKISPKVFLFDEEQICVEKSVIVEKVANC